MIELAHCKYVFFNIPDGFDDNLYSLKHDFDNTFVRFAEVRLIAPLR
jgi:hypothetical protein